MITVVTKAFDGPNGSILAGTVVDSSAFKNEQKLINCNFLRAATESEAQAFTAARPPKGAPSKSARKPKSKATKAKAKKNR